MSLSDSDKNVLEEIIKLEGDCLDGRPRCQVCPFRAMCLPEFINIKPPTKRHRFDLAMRVLAHHCLIDDEDDYIIR